MVSYLFIDSGCAAQVQGIIKNGVPVSNGLPNVMLDMKVSHFGGKGLWMKVRVGSTSMDCQGVLPVPYALGLRPGATIRGNTTPLYLTHTVVGDLFKTGALWYNLLSGVRITPGRERTPGPSAV